MSTARSHALWSTDKCQGCRDLARRAASKARRRDQSGAKLTRALHHAFGWRWFHVDEALPVGMKHGRDRARLEALLVEMGEGDFNPAANTGTPGDGVLLERVIGERRYFRFDLETVAALRGVPRRSVATKRSAIAVVPQRNLGGGHAAPTSPRKEPILDRTPQGDPSGGPVLGHPELGHVDVAQLIERITPDLDEARERGDVLFRVSVTMPPWNWAGATQAAHVFRDSLRRMGASAVLLARDRSKTGAPHWFGIVAVPKGEDRNVIRSLVESAWMAASGAHSGCIRVVAVTAWGAFVESEGDLDAHLGPHTLRANLARVLAYTFKPWPPQHGVRDLVADVVEDGSFVGATLACAA